MKVGFLGVQCDTANMGLAALTYAGVLITRRIITGDAEFVLFSVNSTPSLEQLQHELGLEQTAIKAVPFRHKNPLAMARSLREMASCDFIVDFTGGDSFSDIYGLRRLWRKLFHKQMVLTSRTPLVLAPQTYGPLEHKIARPWFIQVVCRATRVFTRDDLSAEFLRSLGVYDAIIATDVAVTLPWDRTRFELPKTERVRVGVNVSGLLWNGGYTGANQFNLKSDYQEYCSGLVDSLIREGHEVHLVPHVLTRDWESPQEDDFRASIELRDLYPSCILAPRFGNPVEAKSYIAGMDVFVGSRMHATIASFTAGVPTIPVSYSRKFKGFFGTLGYDILVDLAAVDTTSAVEQTLAHIANRASLATKLGPARAIADQRIDEYLKGLVAMISTASQGRVQS